MLIIKYKCDKAHLNECPDFEETQKCPRGSKCPLIHRKKNANKKTSKVYQDKLLKHNNEEDNETVENNEDEKDFIQFKYGTSSKQVIIREDSDSNETKMSDSIGRILGFFLIKNGIDNFFF